MQKFYNKTPVNVGSVGNVVEFLNHDETTKDMSETLQAYYTILEGEYNEVTKKMPISIRFIRVSYDIKKEIKLARKNKREEKNESNNDKTTMGDLNSERI